MSSEASRDSRTALRQGRWPWRYPTMLAPMEGVTHPELRALLASYGGIGMVCTEFIRITNTPLGKRALERQVVKTADAALSVQVMGNDLSNMAAATELVAQAGADVVDINLGCPAPKAVRKGVGSAMLKDPELLFKVVRGMRERTEGPLSAKMRAGFDTSEHAIEIAQTVEAAGVDFISVHPRRMVDQYCGDADHRIVAMIKRATRVPIVANGDLWHATEALRVQRETGCDAVMFGRSALRNPWIFGQLAALRAGERPFTPDGDSVLEHLERYIQVTVEAHPKNLMGMLKEHLRYLLRSLPDSSSAMRSALRHTSLEGLRRELDRLFYGLSALALDLGVESNSPVSPVRVAPTKAALAAGILQR